MAKPDLFKGVFGELETGEEKAAGILPALNSMQTTCGKVSFSNASGKAIKDRKGSGSWHGSCDSQWYAVS